MRRRNIKLETYVWSFLLGPQQCTLSQCVSVPLSDILFTRFSEADVYLFTESLTAFLIKQMPVFFARFSLVNVYLFIESLKTFLTD